MKLTLGFLLLMVFSGFYLAKPKPKVIPVSRNVSYGAGEELEYRVNFTFFTVGRAVTRIDEKFHEMNGKTCYKVDAFGETSDWISIVTKVKDNWGAYVDTASLVTQQSYRKLKEGKYHLDEVVDFDQENNKALVKVRNKDTGQFDPPKVYSVPPNATDLVGGFLYLRNFDFTKVHKGDTITISGFLEKDSYKLKVIYTGKEVISTNNGKIPCIRIRPIMPNNSMFDGENSIQAWISDDLNRIPVKMQAKMFIGNTGLELTGFKGLRNQLKIVP